jgi:hypothetical protein
MRRRQQRINYQSLTIPAIGGSPSRWTFGKRSSLPHPHGWPVFPGGSFRVLTLPTACAGAGQSVAAAWADYRQGVSRIYYALSNNGGASWLTGPSGQPLLYQQVAANQQHFHPQIVSAPGGVMGCAFYEFGPKPSKYLIDVILALSYDGGSTFSQQFTVTDQPWDPSIDAPWSHGDPNVTFIGDYFGLDASNEGLYPLWTDTRTGIQELWTALFTPDPCQHLCDEVDELQTEVDDLWDAFSSGEIPPPPRTPQRVAAVLRYIHQLEARLRHLRQLLKQCRALHPESSCEA